MTNGLPIRLKAPIVVGLAIWCVVEIAALVIVLSDTVTLRHLEDFGLFYSSASRGLTGQNPYRDVVRPGDDTPALSVNLNPPHFLLIVAPLTRLDPLVAFIAWMLIGTVAAFVSLRMIVREVRVHPTPDAIVLMAALMLGAPTGALFMTGQLSWLLWWPITWAWVAARRGHWLASAAVLGVLMSVKPFLAIFLLCFVIDRRWREIGLAIAAAGACGLVGIAAFGWTSFVSWLQTFSQVTWSRFVLNASIYGFLERMLVDVPMAGWNLAATARAPFVVRPLWWVGSSIVLLLSWRAIARDRGGDTRTDRLFAVALIAALLISPVGWIYYHFLLVGPVLALGVREGWWTSSGWRRTLLVLVVISFLPGPGVLTYWQPNALATITLGSLYFWGTVGLLILATASQSRTVGAEVS